MVIWLKRPIFAKFILDIKLPNNEITHMKPGTCITKIVLIAGKGHTKPIDDINRLITTYKKGRKQDWQKYRGECIVEIDGEYKRCEIHWYQVNSFYYEAKVKNIFD